MERINQNDFYMILCNGEPIQPANTDMVMDYWMAETVIDFLQAITPWQIFEIKKVVLIDTPPSQQRPNLRVLP